MSHKEFFILYFFIRLKNNLFILFFDCGGLRCCIQAFSRGQQGLHLFELFRLCCGSFSCCRAQALGMQASVAAACGLSSCGLQALECGLSSCGAQAYLLCSMWDLPRSGIERVSLALQEGFLATGPPGKPLYSLFLLLNEPIDF